MRTTFLTVQLVDHEVRVARALDVVARDDAEERRRRLAACEPFVSDVRVADGEMCAIPAWKYVALEAATAPEVDGPSTARTLLSATNFCASDCAGARALLDRRVAERRA